MFKDIRSYFSPLVKTGSTSSLRNDSSKSKNDKGKKKKRTLILSDSDEDDVVVAQSPLKKSKQNEEEKAPNKRSKKEEEKSKYFSANASDVFGSAPVKQWVKAFKPLPPKAAVKNSPLVDSGIESQDSHTLEMHDNDEFEAVLSQIDEGEWASPQIKSKDKKSSPKTHEVEENLTKSPSKSPVIKKNKSSPISTVSLGSPSRKTNSKAISPLWSKLKSPQKSSPVKVESSKEKAISSSKSPQKSSPVKVESSKENSKACKNGVLSKRSASVFGEETDIKVPKIENKSELKKVVSSTNSFAFCNGKKHDPIPKTSSQTQSTESSSVGSSQFSLWVDKYKPKNTKQIVGQQGEKSIVNKLIKWLKNWHTNQSGVKKLSKPSPWAKDDDGAYFKAALLSGPPGIGKTTTVTLVCQELGFDMVEFNASDTRSKKLLQQEVSELLSCSSLTHFFSGETKKKSVTQNHVLVMDEVDGMAGNEDRGGVQELIQLIKSAKVPVICMCNDRNHPKIRSLLNYCFDLGFHRPRVEQIKAAMMSICFKENLKVAPNVMADIITNSNQDIRSTLNHLSMLAANKSNDSLQSEAKHIKLGPWDVLRKVFSSEEHKTMSIFDKSDLFFHDYQVAPLFVHENYLSVTPYNFDKNKKSAKMTLFARAAESLSKGDLVEKNIRQNSSWGLLPTQAMFSSVIPGEHLAGHVSGRIQFPMWFGKNSRGNKLDRLIQEVQVHTRLRMSGSKEAINLDYMRYLRDAILAPLLKSGSDGVEGSLATLQHYCLTREDLDSICEVSSWPNASDPMSQIESKVKAAFTRAYNKASIVTPYALVAPVKKGKGVKAEEDDLDEGVSEMDEDEEEEDNENVDADAMIVMKKKPAAKQSESNPSTSKGAGKGARGGRGGGKGSRGGKK